MRVRSCLLLFVLSALAACSSDAPSAPVPVDAGSPPDAAPDALVDSGTPIPEGVELTLKAGPIRGEVRETTRVFRGIPYAEPPVGALRWKPPVPKSPWTEVRDASQTGTMCAQLDRSGVTMSGKEDCLTVDVWTPTPVPQKRLPVMVWIHGGGFTTGAGTAAMYRGDNLVPAGPVVMVSVNYRLGPLGFLAHDLLTKEGGSGAASGNYGIMDQQLALQWVRDNIATFGGDPTNVTLFGESAGGISVCGHLVAPKSQGLFERAIVQSGPCSFIRYPLADAEKQGADLAKALGCTDLGCLRGKSEEEVLRALPLKVATLFGSGVGWGPIVDGAVFPKAPVTLIAEGKYAKVPLIMGTNADEGELFTFLANLQRIDEAEYRTRLGEIGSELGIDTAKVMAEYPSSKYGSPGSALAAAITDAGFTCPTRRLFRSLSGQGATAYMYHFEKTIDLLGTVKSFHAADLPFVFGTELIVYQLTEADRPLSASMMGYWTRFANNGDPNGSGAVSWSTYASATEEHLVLDLTIKASSKLRKAECDFWDTLQ